MTNKEKAKELASKYARQYHHNTYPEYSSNSEFVFSNEEIDKACLKMAEWKDEEHKKDMENLILKSANYIYAHAHVTTFGDIRLDTESMTQFVEDFKKAMICGT